MSVWGGIDNGCQRQHQPRRTGAGGRRCSCSGPNSGQHFETGGKMGEAPDIPVVELMKLREEWRMADKAGRERIWHRMLAIHAEQQFSIGVVSGVQQPVVVSNALRNVPEKGLYAWERGRSSACTSRTRSGSPTRGATERRRTDRHRPDRQRKEPRAGLHVRRLLLMIPTLLVISFVTLRDHPAAARGLPVEPDRRTAQPGRHRRPREDPVAAQQFGLDKSFIEQYATWLGLWPGERGFSGLLQGDWGWSFEHNLPVLDVVGDRLALSFVLNSRSSCSPGRWRSRSVSMPPPTSTAGGPWPLAAGLRGSGHAQLPARAGADVLRERPVRLSIGGMMDPQFLDQPMSWASSCRPLAPVDPR